MGRKGGTTHLKRNPAPKFWTIHRKEFVWTVRPKSGPHALQQSLPLTLIVKEMLGYAKTRREAKTIISQGKVLVDGKPREEAYPTGLMDIVAIPEAKATYRILTHKKGLILHPTKEDEANFKLCRIENKTVVPKGQVQLNFHDGTNKLIQVADPKNPTEDEYHTLNVIKLSIPDREVLGQIKMAKDTISLITGGKNRGTYGKIVDIEEVAGKKRRSLLATIENKAGKRFQTILSFIFPVGEGEESISLPEVK
ncbi:30S ribosomal protein S4e [Candidatus Bathyarchaeota archaeon]|nr:30S ribosomal protein S4e [Candidatus Bathyarchaeota archaeon]